MMKPPPVSSALWRQRYEALRQHVMDRSQILSSEPLGLVVLFTRGLAGWMQSWWEVSPEPPGTPVPAPSFSRPAAAPWQDQLTSLLAHMTIQHL